jgi:serine phosphatase RsbU (regulator of sigma subunit)
MYSYSLLGSVFLSYKQYDLAVEYYLKGRDISEKAGNKMALVSTDYNLGIIYLEKGDFKNAVEYSQSALKLAKEINSKEEIKNSYEGLVKVYTKMKQFDKALEYQTLYINMKDSLLNETNSKQLNELQTQYDTEKKQKEIELLTKDQEVKNERIARQNIITYTIVAGLVLVLILTFISFKRYREKKKANIEITHQKEIIELKNKEILDSIHYAKRIQRALLASDKLLNSNLPEHFVLYKPKDIVSGDFYWAQQATNNRFLLATCDCTGHGVPGAFMSLLNISKLNETVIERRVTQPDLIFNNVREEIIHALNHDGSTNDAKDGMDAILCSFDFKNMKMELVAANNPVIIIRNNELIEIKPDKFPVGLHQGELKPFTLKSFDLQKGDVIYTFTDGYPDQFGGPNAKKLMSKNFKEILLKGHMNDMLAQKENLNSIFENWRGELEQLDDVLVIGVRV